MEIVRERGKRGRSGMDLLHSRLAAAMKSGGTSSSAIYHAVLTTAQQVDPTPSIILDFGSGAGQLLPVLEAAFPHAALHAADIMERPNELAPYVTWHRGDLNEDTGIAAESFDLICAIEVIEHLENPRHMIREIARMLKPGGCALLSTPNTGSVRSVITFAMRGHHAQFDDTNYPAHIMAIGAADFARIGAEAGLTLERYFYTDSGTVPKLLSHRWQDIPALGSRMRGRWFSDNYGVVLRKPSS